MYFLDSKVLHGCLEMSFIVFHGSHVVSDISSLVKQRTLSLERFISEPGKTVKAPNPAQAGRRLRQEDCS